MMTSNFFPRQTILWFQIYNGDIMLFADAKLKKLQVLNKATLKIRKAALKILRLTRD